MAQQGAAPAPYSLRLGRKLPSLRLPAAGELVVRQLARGVMKNELSESERTQIAEILSRRANEIARFNDEYRENGNHLGSVELALTREIERLRQLVDRVNSSETKEQAG